MEIKDYTEKILFEDRDADCPSRARMDGLSLAYADFTPFNCDMDCVGMRLGGCDLTGATFRGLDIAGSDLSYACLVRVDLSDCDLDDCKFAFSNLSGVDLTGSQLNWSSHDLIAHILHEHAWRECFNGDAARTAEGRGEQYREFHARLQFAGCLLLCREYCWSEFIKMEHPQMHWAAKVLYSHLTPGELGVDISQGRPVAISPSGQMLRTVCTLQEGAYLIRRAVEYGDHGYSDPDPKKITPGIVSQTIPVTPQCRIRVPKTPEGGSCLYEEVDSLVGLGLTPPLEYQDPLSGDGD